MLDMKEFYTASKDDILSIHCQKTAFNPRPEYPQPPTFQAARPAIRSYIERAHAIITILLRHLTKLLQLPAGTLENLHRQSVCSGDQVRWIKIQPSGEARVEPGDEILLDEHSDCNSITLLFNILGGLEIRQPCSSDLITGSDGEDQDPAPVRWIRAGPLPGHCIVHLGEQIARLSSGILRASVHRVCAPSSTGVEGARYSLVYFARPEDSVILKQLEGIPVVPRPHIPIQPSRKRSASRKPPWMTRWIKKRDR